MKCIVTFYMLFGVVFALPLDLEILSGALLDDPTLDRYPLPYLLVEQSPGVFVVQNLTAPPGWTGVEVKDSDVKFYLYTRTNPQQGIEIDSNNISLVDTPFDPLKETGFVVHGWISNNSSPINHLLKDAILLSKDVNVFIVDWSPLADENYFVAHAAVSGVADVISKFVRVLETAKHLSLDQSFMVGHSLGAHVSGIVGSDMNSQMDHIVGLDPAWPLYSVSNIADRLDYTDAKYVQVIHTCGGKLGFPISIGHSDYYPNGGKDQKGCPLTDITGRCSHRRAYQYLAESINRGKFLATRCSSYEEYEKGDCKDQPTSWMGGYYINKQAVGDYYLDTNPQSPFAKD